MKTIHGLLIIIATSVVAMSARAEDVVLVSSFIPYQKADTANEVVSKECHWNTTMLPYLAKESEGRVKVAEQGFDTATGKKLILVATNLHTVGGGGWTGPKWLALEGRLMEGNKLLGNFEARRQTIRGSFRACSTLESLSEDISDDILKWLSKPGMNTKLGDAG